MTNRIVRRVRTAVDPMSTVATRWWCHSAMRYMLTGAWADGQAVPAQPPRDDVGRRLRAVCRADENPCRGDRRVPSIRRAR
jgi:hypothetical protein